MLKILLFPTLCFAQNTDPTCFHILDKQSNLPITDVVAVLKGNFVSATNEDGMLCINVALTDTIKFYHTTYEIKTLLIEDGDTVFLTPRNLTLEETVIISEKGDPAQLFTSLWNASNKKQFGNIDSVFFKYKIILSYNGHQIEKGNGEVLVGYDLKTTKPKFQKLLFVSDTILDSSALSVIDKYGANRLYFILAEIPFVTSISSSKSRKLMSSNHYLKSYSDSVVLYQFIREGQKEYQEIEFCSRDSTLLNYISFYNLEQKNILPMQRKLILSFQTEKNVFVLHVSVFDRIYITNKSWLDVTYEIYQIENSSHNNPQAPNFFPTPNYNAVKYFARKANEIR